jgi:5-methyltetrahydrofolate--homocysteine methyltransferase
MNMAEMKCVYDPLVELMNYYSGSKFESKDKDTKESLTIEDKLKRRIVDGDRIGLDDDLKKALEKYSALQIINEILLDGMKVVGELFGSGQMQLPFVLQSAETMKAAVNFLERFMEKVEGSEKGVMVLATVKGDVHDIGKNLVDIILTNNGYKVINLGIKVPIEQIIEAAEKHKADAIGMSGLLVKSTVVMKENLEQMRERGYKIPVVLGGAALTRRYVENDLRSVYYGTVEYANDAFDGLRFMEKITSSSQQVDAEREVSSNAVLLDNKPKGKFHSINGSKYSQVEIPAVLMTSNVSREVPVPTPPFYGSTTVTDIKLETIWRYLNEVALIRGQWQVSRKGKTEEEYKRILQQEVYPVLDELKLKVKRERIFKPKVVYGYFPCQSDGNDLIIYKPQNETELYRKWMTISPQKIERDQLVEWVRFHFPRQTSDRFLCISDFFKSVDSGQLDVVALQAVTIGGEASDYTKKLFESNRYLEYLYLHGLSVESAEALAEYWHKVVREELGIAGKDSPEIKRLFSQGYQGSRYSFGYPACPNLEDQVKLFEILRPERIGMTLTEEYQLVPEQSTTAVIVHHPEAKYFNIK